jgi:hypothetical protein
VRDRVLGVAGVAAAFGATLWALAGGPAAAVGTLVVIGMVFAAADAAVWHSTGNTTSVDLDVPAGRRLPPPPWTVLVAATAVLGVVAAAVGDAVPVAVGAGLVGVAALRVLLRRPSDLLPVRTVATARRLRVFVRAHGVDSGHRGEGYLAAVGEPGTRLLVVAPDGTWADVMLGSDAADVAALAGIDLRDPNDPATGRRLRIDSALWARMTESW